MVEANPEIINFAGYRFTPLKRLEELKESLKERSRKLGLRGSILLSEEGINVYLAGSRTQFEDFKKYLHGVHRVPAFEYKESLSQFQPFKRMIVKVKNEIIRMNQPEVKPADHPAPRISAKELKNWMDEKKDFILLDARNRFEFNCGSFKQAVELQIKSFGNFPQALMDSDKVPADKPIVTFCTGGIRCEKAAPFMLQNGFKEVYQLDGGILKYLEECGDEHFRGDCFVFDQRETVDGNLKGSNESAEDFHYTCDTQVRKKDEGED